MIIGLTGPTDLTDPRREDLASKFGGRVFWFEDLTIQYIKELGLLYRGKTYEELESLQDATAMLALKQRVWDGLHNINPTIYTDWMTSLLAKEVFSKGLKVNNSTTEAVIADVRSEKQAQWLRRFATDRHNRLNKIVYIPGKSLPAPLGLHASEQLIEADETLDLSTPIQKEVDRIRKQFYVTL